MILIPLVGGQADKRSEVLALTLALYWYPKRTKAATISVNFFQL
jgi:hypothetical protein